MECVPVRNCILTLKDVDHASGMSGMCYKNIFEAMGNLMESVPEPIKQICVKDFCEVAPCI